jgi:DNA-binding transcriptional MerR regulator
MDRTGGIAGSDQWLRVRRGVCRWTPTEVGAVACHGLPLPYYVMSELSHTFLSSSSGALRERQRGVHSSRRRRAVTNGAKIRTNIRSLVTKTTLERDFQLVVDFAARGITTDNVRKLAGGLKPSTLDYWVRSGLVEPTVQGSRGHRFTRQWTVQEAVTVRMISALRDAGCPLQRIRDAKAYLEENWGETFSSRVLVWDGVDDIFDIGPWGEVRSVWKRPGQLAFKAVAMPVDTWRREAEAELRSA